MSGRDPRVHVVTIRERDQVVVVARGHPAHGIGNDGRCPRLTVHPMPASCVGEVLDATYGRVVHTAGMGQAE